MRKGHGRDLAHRVDSLRCEGSDAIGAKRTCRERRERVDLTKMPSRPGEFHPEPLSESCSDFSATFTTIVFDNPSLRWLEINT
jgi:hypothetical protein